MFNAFHFPVQKSPIIYKDIFMGLYSIVILIDQGPHAPIRCPPNASISFVTVTLEENGTEQNQ